MTEKREYRKVEYAHIQHVVLPLCRDERVNLGIVISDKYSMIAKHILDDALLERIKHFDYE